MPKGAKRGGGHGCLLKRRDECDDDDDTEESEEEITGSTTTSRSEDCCCHNLKCKNAISGKKHKCDDKFPKNKKVSYDRVLVPGWEAEDDLSSRRQKLELQLSKAQIEEAHHNDQHDLLQLRFERIEKLMQSLVQYLDCLQLEVKASQRFCQSLNSLIVNEKSVTLTDGLSALIRKFCEKPSCPPNYTMRDRVLKALSVGGGGGDGRFEELTLTYEQKKRDFNVASQNFKILLQNANLNSAQLEKLQRQFESILLSFQHSRCMLDQEAPNVISSRMQLLVDSFRHLVSDLTTVASDRLDLSSLLEHLESSMRSCGGDPPVTVGNSPSPLSSTGGGAAACNSCSRPPAASQD